MKGEKLQELLHDTISLTKQVAAFIKHEQEYFKASAIEYKGLNDLVSFVDKEAERKLVTGLADAPALQDSLLATGFPYYNFNKMENYLAILKDYMQKTHGLRRMGSAAVDLVYVACGRFEAFFEYNLKPWDVAAGTLIVQEAGGRVTDFKDGEDFIFGGELLAANRIHAEALDVIKQHWD
jgi:fructose-1,6-bisphosphatase/inositol monophosphatase family enzyme